MQVLAHLFDPSYTAAMTVQLSLLDEAGDGDGNSVPALQGRLERTVAGLDELVARERLDAFAPLTLGRLSVNKRLDRFRHAVGLLRGPFEARNG